MKQEVRILIKEGLLRRAKRHATDEGRSLNDVIQDALEKYLSADLPDPTRREAAFQLFCERPIKLAPEQLKVVLEHDSWSL